MTRRLVVVGGVAAGMSAASRARRLDPDLEVLVFEAGPHVAYGACGLPYFLAGMVSQPEDLLAYPLDSFRRERNIHVYPRHRVLSLDLEHKLVRVRAGSTDFSIPFGRLVLSTGAEPLRPDLPGADLAGVFTLRTLADGVAIRDYVRAQEPRRAVIVGAGYVGLEMAEAFSRLGMTVTLLEKAGQVLPGWDAHLAGELAKAARAAGVDVRTGAPLQAMEGTTRVRSVTFGGGSAPADLVLLALGVRPAAGLAAAAGLRLGAAGAIEVDLHQQTSHPDVFAAGDCAQTRHLVTGSPAYIPLGTTANKQGRVAGANAAGGNEEFPGVVGTRVVAIFGLEAARTGLTEAEAAAAGMDPVTAEVEQTATAGFYPGPGPVRVHLAVDRRSRRVVGAQMLGAGGVSGRINTIAAALQGHWTIDELSSLDLGYAPPVAPVWDPILIAARAAERVLEGENRADQ